MTWLTQCSSIRYFISQFGVCRPWFDVIRFQPASSDLTNLTSIVVAFKYRFAPFFVKVALTLTTFWQTAFPCVMIWAGHPTTLFTLTNKWSSIWDATLSQNLLTCSLRILSFFFRRQISHVFSFNLCPKFLYRGGRFSFSRRARATQTVPCFNRVSTAHLPQPATSASGFNIWIVILREFRAFWKYDFRSHDVNLLGRFANWLDSLKFYPHFLGESLLF